MNTFLHFSFQLILFHLLFPQAMQKFNYKIVQDIAEIEKILRDFFLALLVPRRGLSSLLVGF